MNKLKFWILFLIGIFVYGQKINIQTQTYNWTALTLQSADQTLTWKFNDSVSGGAVWALFGISAANPLDRPNGVNVQYFQSNIKTYINTSNPSVPLGWNGLHVDARTMAGTEGVSGGIVSAVWLKAEGTWTKGVNPHFNAVASNNIVYAEKDFWYAAAENPFITLKDGITGSGVVVEEIDMAMGVGSVLTTRSGIGIVAMGTGGTVTDRASDWGLGIVTVGNAPKWHMGVSIGGSESAGVSADGIALKIWPNHMFRGIDMTGATFDTMAYTPTSISKANPAVITRAFHGLSTDEHVDIFNCTSGWAAMNGSYAITRLTVDTYSVPVNSIAFTGTANCSVQVQGRSIKATGIAEFNRITFGTGNTVAPNIIGGADPAIVIRTPTVGGQFANFYNGSQAWSIGFVNGSNYIGIGSTKTNDVDFNLTGTELIIVNNSSIQLPNIKSTTGQVFVCVNNVGLLVRSATACVGTI